MYLFLVIYVNVYCFSFFCRPSYAFLLFSLSCPSAKLHDINKCMYFLCSLPLAVLFVPEFYLLFVWFMCMYIWVKYLTKTDDDDGWMDGLMDSSSSFEF